MKRRDPLGTAALAVVAALAVAVGIYRIPAVDVPWHLATGRLILGGTLPVTNTFSWTWPDHPLHQQYPLFQAALALLADHAGWEAVTLANAAAWAAGIALWARWGGTWRDAVDQPLLWLVVVAGVQRHHVARPEVVTLIGLGALLVCLDRYAASRQRRWLLGVVVAQWAMVNGHQMWPLGIALQGAFLVHLGLVRAAAGRIDRVDGADRDLPLLPPLAALAASVLVLAISPLGPGVYLAPLTTLDTLLSQGQATAGGAAAAELAPVWTDPLSTLLAAILFLVAGVAVSATVRHRRLHPFDLAVLGLGAALVLAAIRGMPFAAVAAGAVASRSRARTGPAFPDGSPVRAAAALTAVALSALLLKISFALPPACDRVERGLGRTRCGWGDATAALLRSDPPPGQMLNLGWVAGNPMIGGVWPARGVFVDPRWEAYPRPFLLGAIAAVHDGERLRELIAQYRPGFVVAETREADVALRVGELYAEGWVLVHADTELAVLVPKTPETAAWLGRHPPLDPATARPADGWSPLSVIGAQQRIRFGRLLAGLGAVQAGAELVAEAATVDDPVVAALLADLPPPLAPRR